MTDQVEAALNEAEPKRAFFTFGGEQFEVRRFDLRVKAAAERGREGLVLELMIGKDQMDRLLSIDTDEVLTSAHVIDAMKAWAEANGTSVGESGASTDS